MIRHVVAFELVATDEEVRATHAQQIRERLESLRDVCDGIIALDVFNDLATSTNHWPLVLIADYRDARCLEDYQNHPRHHEVVQWLNSGVVRDRVIVDFELP